MSNMQPIEQARDADLRLSRPAMQRAAQRAREIAARTGTSLVVSEDGKVRRLEVETLPLQVQQPTPPYGHET